MTADVVIPIYRDVELTRACVESVLQHSGAFLGRVFLVDDCSPDAAMPALLSELRLRHSQVRLLRNSQNLGFVRAANLGLAASETDVVVLNSDALVTPGWMQEMLEVFNSDPRIAALSPLSNNAGMCSVPNYAEAFPSARMQVDRLRLDGLPPFTELPTAPGFCLLMRRKALAQVGLFDRAYGRGYHEENDWCQRARASGWRVGRANRAFVFHEGEVSFQGERSRLDRRNGWRLAARYPQFFDQARAFDESTEARLAARAARAALGLLVVGVGAQISERCDVVFLRPGKPAPKRAVRVALLEDSDAAALTRGELDSFLKSSAGVVVSPQTSAEVEARFPSLRRCADARLDRLLGFARELALRPAQSA